MFTITTEIMREMLEIGMIDKEEYDEAIAEYRSHVEALMAFDYMTKKAKEQIDSIKMHEKEKIEEPDPKYVKLCDLYVKGRISEEYFRRLSIQFESERTRKKIKERMMK